MLAGAKNLLKIIIILIIIIIHPMNPQPTSALGMHLVSHASETNWKGFLGELDQARLVALMVPHSSDWLFALPITSCGLRLFGEPVRVAVGLRLVFNICEPHTCRCGPDVGAKGAHGLSCKKVADGQQTITKSITLYGEHCDAPISLPRRNPRVL